jgi:hypothetical protein
MRRSWMLWVCHSKLSKQIERHHNRRIHALPNWGRRTGLRRLLPRTRFRANCPCSRQPEVGQTTQYKRVVGTNPDELEKNQRASSYTISFGISRMCIARRRLRMNLIRAEEKECGLASRLRVYGLQRSVLVNVVAEGVWQSCLKHFGRLLRSLSRSFR